MPQVDVNGASLEYVEEGTGEPLVLVHGTFCDHRTWHGQRATFGRYFRTIAYSRRYHWPNAPIPPDADYSILEHADDLRAVLTALDAVPAHVVGHSYGGFVSLLLAIREPALFRSLVLIEPPALTLFVSDPPKPLELLKLAATRPRTAAAIVATGARGLGPATAAFARDDLEEALRLFVTAIISPDAFETMPPERLEQARVNCIKAEFLGSGFPPVDTDGLRQITTPTLLMTGERSRPFFHRMTDRLDELLPHASRVEIPGATHDVPRDNPEAFNAAVLAFLARHGASRRVA